MTHILHCRFRQAWSVGLILAAGVWMTGCGGSEGLPPGVVPTTEVKYIGSAACGSCHAGVAATHGRHGHSQALKAVQDGAPSYPTEAPGVPDPPAGLSWADISYVVDGYRYAGLFINTDGYVLTNGAVGTDTKYNLAFAPTGRQAGFVPYLPGQAQPLPFSYDDFSRLTTGPLDLTDSEGQRQENRPGIQGTWAEAGVQCEACHGPGSVHVPNPSAGNINLDANDTACSRCHSRGADDVIEAAGGLIDGFQQAEELAVSPHAFLACTFCHDPHASVEAEGPSAIRNDCLVCHANQDMALHQGFVYRQGDYEEPVTCASCHMPFAVSTWTSNDLALSNGNTVRLGDTRSHIFILDPSPTSLTDMFGGGGTSVSVDDQGRAAVSTCLVCQRCHNGLGNAFAFPPDQGCAFGADIHLNQ